MESQIGDAGRLMGRAFSRDPTAIYMFPARAERERMLSVGCTWIVRFSYLFAEVYSAKLGDDGKPVTGADGFYVADKPLLYTAMARDAGWGKDIPEMLRNENWNYAIFTLDKKPRPGVNQAECLACHKPIGKASYTFTLKELAAAKEPAAGMKY